MDIRQHIPSPQPDKLHLCLITETYPPEINGVAMTLQRLVNGLSLLGHRISLVRPRQPGTDISGDDDPGVTLVPGLPIPGYRDLHLGLPAGRRLQRLLEEQRPDVLYIATEGPLGSAALSRARRMGIPVVSGFHTNFHNYTRHYHMGVLNKFVLAYLRRFHNRTATTLVPNETLQAQLQQLGFNNVAILERGVDCQLFSPQRRDADLRASWGVNGKDPVVLYVGRLAAEKNIDLLLRSYRAMQQQHTTLKCVMVGDGPLFQRLKKIIRTLFFVACTPVSPSPPIMHRRIFSCFPAKPRPLAMSRWKPWPAAWLS